MSQPLGISVIVATYNRAESLKTTLHAFMKLHPPDLPWELIIVDNNSRDHTKEVVCAFEGRLPIRYMVETAPGGCEARNRGIRCATYDVLVFTDDDITPYADWLTAYSDAVVSNPDIGYFGGPIALDLSATGVPDWARNERGDLATWIRLSLAYYDEENHTSWPGEFYGGNMAFHHFVFERFGLFNPRLGHTGSRRLAAEETYLQRTLIHNGVRSLFVQAARVSHRIRPDEMSVESRMTRMWWTGRGFAVMNTLLGDDRPINVKRWGRNAIDILEGWFTMQRSTERKKLQVQAEIRRRLGYETQMLSLAWSRAGIR